MKPQYYVKKGDCLDQHISFVCYLFKEIIILASLCFWGKYIYKKTKHVYSKLYVHKKGQFVEQTINLYLRKLNGQLIKHHVFLHI